jgi:hypothetical protein
MLNNLGFLVLPFWYQAPLQTELYEHNANNQKKNIYLHENIS